MSESPWRLHLAGAWPASPSRWRRLSWLRSVTANLETANYDMDVLYALDTRTGRLQWADEVPSGSSIADRALPSAPLALGDVLYFASGAQRVL
jgi:hypothetical protein